MEGGGRHFLFDSPGVSFSFFRQSQLVNLRRTSSDREEHGSFCSLDSTDITCQIHLKTRHCISPTCEDALFPPSPHALRTRTNPRGELTSDNLPSQQRAWPCCSGVFKKVEDAAMEVAGHCLPREVSRVDGRPRGATIALEGLDAAHQRGGNFTVSGIALVT